MRLASSAPVLPQVPRARQRYRPFVLMYNLHLSLLLIALVSQFSWLLLNLVLHDCVLWLRLLNFRMDIEVELYEFGLPAL